MLSPTVRAAARTHGSSILPPTATEGAMLLVVNAYEVGYAAGYVAPKAQTFPLSGQREFLRLLAPYLAENITVYHPRTGRYGLLRGLPATYTGQGEPLADVEFYCDAEARAEGCGDITEPVGKLLPVLYGFEDLATDMLLPDGRRGVPAVEVAKLGGGHDNIDNAEFLRDIFGKTRLSLTAYGKHCWSIYGASFTAGSGYSLQEINYLRAAHFAVGLAPHQYHRRQPGFDYASGAKPTAACAGDGCASCAVCANPAFGKEVARA